VTRSPTPTPEDGPTQHLQNALALLDALQHELVTRITGPVPHPDHPSLRTLAATKDHSVWVQWDDGDVGYAFIHDLRRHP